MKPYGTSWNQKSTTVLHDVWNWQLVTRFLRALMYKKLVGGFNLPLWKMMEWVTVGMMTFPIWWESHNPFHGSSHHQSAIDITLFPGFWLKSHQVVKLTNPSFKSHLSLVFGGNHPRHWDHLLRFLLLLELGLAQRPPACDHWPTIEMKSIEINQ